MRIPFLPAAAVVSLFLSAQAAPTQAASFDCAAARTPIERAICADPELSERDEALAALYAAARNALPEDGASDFVQEQRAWLKERNAACRWPTAACLRPIYDARIDALLEIARAGATPDAEAVVAPAAIPAAGRNEARLETPALGRYAVWADSDVGVALTLVAKDQGPRGPFGRAGIADGRVDLFLERGDYSLRLAGPETAEGEARLNARRFRELHAGPVRLVEGAAQAAELGDFEQRSYWIEIDETRDVAIEAAGRRLGDLRLWRDGSWLHEAAPAREILEPTPGKPLVALRLATRLEPGLYLVVAYGGPGEVWSVEGDEQPLLLRYGPPRLAEAGRRRVVAGPTGIDRWILPGSATYVRVDALSGAAPDAAVSLGFGSPGAPFAARIVSGFDKTSRAPTAEAQLSAQVEDRVLEVRAPPGTPYVLQHFAALRTYAYDVRLAAGRHWASILPSGFPVDQIDLTAIVARHGDDEALAAKALTLDRRTRHVRRANLGDAATLYVQVQEPGVYVIEGEAGGRSLSTLFQPVFDEPEGFVPRWEASGFRWELNPGLWRLTLRPRDGAEGIAEFSIGAPEAQVVDDQTRIAANFTLNLRRRDDLRFQVGHRPGSKNGLVLRSLPIDLSEDLPLALQPGETAALQVEAPAAGEIFAEAEDGTLLPIRVDGAAAAQQKIQVAAGWRVVEATNDGAAPVFAALRFVPEPQAEATPPSLARAAARSRAMPELRAGEPQWFDMEPEDRRSFRIRVDRAGFYRVESLGLLELDGALRTRLAPTTSSRPGPGRNFRIDAYLGQGDYVITVAAKGKGRGPVGLAMTAAPVLAGGDLTLTAPRRATLPAGQGIVYDMAVAEAGDYAVDALALGRSHALRVEDAEGWPLTAPGVAGPLTLNLDPGAYRLFVLPPNMEARAVATLEKVERTPAPPPGHGPHALPLRRTVAHVWTEPRDGGLRTPDAWDFALPSDVDVSIGLSDGMAATLRPLEEGAAPLARFGGDGWRGRLSAGRYRIEAASLLPNAGLPYEIRLDVAQRMPGETWRIEPPSRTPLIVGEGQIDLSSFGRIDLRARLVDAAGRTVAESDDRPDDWNFHVAGRFPAGVYELVVEPVGASRRAETVAVSYVEIPEVARPPLAAPANADLADLSAHLFPIAPEAATDGLLVAVAASDGVAGLSLERRGVDGAWTAIAQDAGALARVAAPPGAEAAPLRLRVWSADRSGAPIRLELRRAAPEPLDLTTLTQAGAPLSPIATGTGAARAHVERPILLRVDGVALAGAEGAPALSRPEGGAASVAGEFWLLGDANAIARVAPTALSEAPVVASVPAGRPAEIFESVDGPTLWIAEALGRQPGLGFVGEGVAGAGFAPGEAALATIAGGSRTVALWNAGDRDAALDAALRRIALTPTQPIAAGLGVARGTLPARTAATLTLPAGGKRLDILLPARTAMVLEPAGEARTLWSGKAPRRFLVDTDAVAVALLSVEGGDYAATVSAGDGGNGGVAPGRFVSRFAPTRGDIRLRVEGAGTLRVAGAVDGASFVGADGAIRRGDVLQIAGGGELTVAAKGGPVVVWLDDGGFAAPEGAASPNAATPVAPPATVALSGAATRLSVAAERPQILRLRSETPTVVQIRRLGAPIELTLHPDGVDLRRPIWRGGAEILIHPLGGAPSFAALSVIAEPAEPLTEGVAAPRLLEPGGAALFVFDLAEERSVGVGARSAPDVATSRLLTADGAPLGDGAALLRVLPPGRYLLSVEIPADAPPTEVRPALIGSVDRSDLMISDDDYRRILDSIGADR